jgi:SAM-dependent methyltransferase
VPFTPRLNTGHLAPIVSTGSLVQPLHLGATAAGAISRATEEAHVVTTAQIAALHLPPTPRFSDFSFPFGRTRDFVRFQRFVWEHRHDVTPERAVAHANRVVDQFQAQTGIEVPKIWEQSRFENQLRDGLAAGLALTLGGLGAGIAIGAAAGAGFAGIGAVVGAAAGLIAGIIAAVLPFPKWELLDRTGKMVDAFTIEERFLLHRAFRPLYDDARENTDKFVPAHLPPWRATEQVLHTLGSTAPASHLVWFCHKELLHRECVPRPVQLPDAAHAFDEPLTAYALGLIAMDLDDNSKLQDSHTWHDIVDPPQGGGCAPWLHDIAWELRDWPASLVRQCVRSGRTITAADVTGALGGGDLSHLHALMQPTATAQDDFSTPVIPDYVAQHMADHENAMAAGQV